MKWLVNDIGRRAAVSTSEPYSTDFPAVNFFYGGSNLIAKRSEAGTSTSNIQLDLGAGASDTVDFVAFRGVNLLRAIGLSFTLLVRGSNDNFVSTTNIYNDTITVTDAVGSTSDDWIEFATESAAYRYFDIRISGTASGALRYGGRKLYIGTAFDFGGIAPRYPYSLNLINPAQSPMDLRAGSAFGSSSGKSFYILEGSYHGISDALRDQFVEKVVRYSADYPMWVYTDDSFGHGITSDFNSLFGWCSFEITSGEQWKDNNVIRFRVREDVI